MVAVIGVLAAVGIPMYNGYITSAKIAAAKENHVRIRDMTMAIFTRCSGGASTTKMMAPSVATGVGPTTRPCYGPESGIGYYAGYLVSHFTATGCKNPYNASESCAFATHTSDPSKHMLGGTYLWHGSQEGYTAPNGELYIRTYFSDEDGEKVYLTDKIVRE